MAQENKYWNLEDFVDSLVVELDKTRETLAVKAINKPLSYSVKDLSLDLNTFPTYDGDKVTFITAQPGQQGSSKLTLQLGSITDQQVRATSKPVALNSETKIDEIDVDAKTKKQLRKIGVNSVEDLKMIEDKNVDVKKATDNNVDYKSLANLIQKNKRSKTPPVVKSVSMSLENPKQPQMIVKGLNLSTSSTFKPVAVINNQLAEVITSNAQEITIAIDPKSPIRTQNEVILTVDPYAVFKFNLNLKQKQ
ncbi:MAG: hypothetical protein KG003_02140 [Bacteroidetes bacterium]|nr:hypothetical protein [Bacteroidota bacterium]